MTAATCFCRDPAKPHWTHSPAFCYLTSLDRSLFAPRKTAAPKDP